MIDFEGIEKSIGYTFKDRKLLETALTHSSYSHENPDKENYERLEFVGDALLDYWVGVYLFENYPDKKEGELTKLRSNLVKEETLAEICESLGFMHSLRFVQGAQKYPVMQSSAVRCDVFEAVLGAVLVDCGKDFSTVGRIISRFILPYIHKDFKDYKSALYEYAAQKGYTVSFVSEVLPEDTSIYSVRLFVNGKEVSRAQGPNKKKAEAEASRIYLTSL